VAILHSQDGPAVAAWSEGWALECKDEFILAELAKVGIESWRKADPSGFLSHASNWATSTKRPLRIFALMAFRAAVEDPCFEDLPTVFRVSAGLAETVRGESRRVLYDMVEKLARRSPPEAARFLLDELAKGGEGARRLARTTLPVFPSRQRELIERTLSG
jgi:hypothetical protein